MFAVIAPFMPTKPDSRHRLNGVLVETFAAPGSGARLTATDGQILATVLHPALDWPHPPTIVPRALVDWLAKHPDATLTYNPATATLTGADARTGATLTTIPIDDTYPNWRAVWPAHSHTTAPDAPHPVGYDARLVARICKAAAAAAKLTGAQPERMPLQFETFPNSNNRFTVALGADGARLSGVIMPLRDTAAPMPDRPL